MKPMFQPFKMDVPGNDSRHNLKDDNQGGSPRGGTGAKRVPMAQRGGFQQQGRDKVYQRAQMGRDRSGSGNPASRGGASIGSMQPHTRIPGHGGSPQHRGGAGTGRNFGRSGQQGVPSYSHASPQPGRGNTSGTTYRQISGRFTRKAMGARPTGDAGKYGSAPVTTNT